MVNDELYKSPTDKIFFVIACAVQIVLISKPMFSTVIVRCL